jgi:hypothetical protein
MARTIGAAVGALLVMLFLADIAARLSPSASARTTVAARR